jgi:hypothetical protein
MNSSSTASKKAIIYPKINRKIFPNISKIYVQLLLLTTLSSVHMKQLCKPLKNIHIQYPWGHEWNNGEEVLDFSDNLHDP